MSDGFRALEQRIDRVIEQLTSLQTENARLRNENGELRGELNELKKSLDRVKLTQGDQGELVRSKLVSVLERIEELERIGL
ncbi:MAG: cell division protein ZapB [candidate division Zixibacteria bacterium]|nr:cell division protein ZapB [candidate division Zixibacteria bacterium]